MSISSVERTAAELQAVLERVRGPDAALDPALGLAATDTAELAHRHGAGLVAVVEHRDADPAMLVAKVVPVDRRIGKVAAGDLGSYLADAGGPDIREVTRTTTATGHQAVIVERIPVSGRMTGAQLQVLVLDRAGPRMAVFTLHSSTGRGWLELAGLVGHLVAGLEFDQPSPVAATRRPGAGEVTAK